MIRWTRPSDREEIKALWQARFGDSQTFTDWFFRERFSPVHSAVTEENGHIVCSVQSWPCHMRIRDILLPCCIISGVSTDLRFERQGHMRRTMTYLLNGIGERGGTVVTYRPENPDVYLRFGHFPCSRTAYFRAEPVPQAEAPDLTLLDISEDADAIHLCYQRFSRRYSGIIQRSAADMRLKLADYASDGGYVLGLRDGDELRGYCICFSEEKNLHAEECAAAEPSDFTHLLAGLRRLGAQEGRTVSGKLPTDAVPSDGTDGFSVEIRPMNLMGVGDVRGLLRALGRDHGFRIEIFDPVIPANRGIFDLNGKTAEGAPQLRIESGRLAQFLCGFHSLAELCGASLAEAPDPDAVTALDALYPKQNCYIVDEY